jgi:polyisoprenoid-binding protein YceI
MKTIFSLIARVVRTRLTMLVVSLSILFVLPVHAAKVQCELIENSQVNPGIIARMLEAADEGHLYRVDTGRSRIGFQVKHFPFSKVEGAFNRFDGGLTLPEGNNPSRVALFLVKADSMATGDHELDDYLKSASFFNAAQFPDIIFVSTGFERLGGSTARLYGDLTLRGITRSLAFTVHVDQAAGQDADNDHAVVIHADADLQRSEFGMHALSLLVSDTVTLSIRIEATRVRI